MVDFGVRGVAARDILKQRVSLHYVKCQPLVVWQVNIQNVVSKEKRTLLAFITLWRHSSCLSKFIISTLCVIDETSLVDTGVVIVAVKK